MPDILQTLAKVVGSATFMGPNLTPEQAVELLAKAILNASEAMEVVFFFPEWSGLKEVTVYGVPPQVGEKVYLRTYRGPLKDAADEGKEYNDYERWIVQSVDRSICVEPDPVEALRKAVNFKPANTYRAEVRLGKSRNWRRKRKKNQ